MKRFVLPALRGALFGIAAQYLLSIAISIKLQLGYLMAYITTLAEVVHGEMNAVLLEAALSAILGMGVSLAVTFARQRAWAIRKRCIAIALSVLASCAPVIALTARLLFGLG